MADGVHPNAEPDIDDPARSTPERARQWAAFYDDLIQFEEGVLESMRKLSEGMTGEERKAVLRTNIEPLQELISDFGRRLELWRRRIEVESGGLGET